MEATVKMKFDPETVKETEVPNYLLKRVHDKNDRVLFGSNYTKGKVSYNYIPAEYMTTGRPLIISTSISYDGVGNSEGLPEDAIMMDFTELPKMFPDNKFH